MIFMYKNNAKWRGYNRFPGHISAESVCGKQDNSETDYLKQRKPVNINKMLYKFVNERRK